MKKVLVLLCSILFLALSGCLLQSADELYALPKQSDEYYTLQAQIEAVLNTGAEYCAPISGDRRQAVQLADLDSDGQEEAIVFFRTQEKLPLKIYIFKMTSQGYARLGIIEGEGSAFESVDYRQIDTNLGLELVVGRQVSNQVPQTLSVYALEGSHVTELLNVSCIRHQLADLDGNGLQDLLVFRTKEDASVGMAEYYSWGDAGLELEGSANMTGELTADSIRRVVYGMMQENVPAVFVANAYGESDIVTDVFTLVEGNFGNVAGANDTARIRYREVFAMDLDSDGLIELPETRRLPSLASDTTPYYIINWYNLCQDGTKQYKLSTFHNYTDGWYLEIPMEWKRNFAAAYIHGSLPCYRFYQSENGNARPMFEIYALSGQDAAALAQTEERFVLAQKGDVVYVGKCLDDAVSQQLLISQFHFIVTDWNSGEV